VLIFAQAEARVRCGRLCSSEAAGECVSGSSVPASSRRHGDDGQTGDPAVEESCTRATRRVEALSDRRDPDGRRRRAISHPWRSRRIAQECPGGWSGKGLGLEEARLLSGTARKGGVHGGRPISPEYYCMTARFRGRAAAGLRRMREFRAVRPRRPPPPPPPPTPPPPSPMCLCRLRKLDFPHPIRRQQAGRSLRPPRSRRRPSCGCASSRWRVDRQHGVGGEKRDLMPRCCPRSISIRATPKCPFDDKGPRLTQPRQGLPTLHRCAELGRMMCTRARWHFGYSEVLRLLIVPLKQNLKILIAGGASAESRTLLALPAAFSRRNLFEQAEPVRPGRRRHQISSKRHGFCAPSRLGEALARVDQRRGRDTAPGTQASASTTRRSVRGGGHSAPYSTRPRRLARVLLGGASAIKGFAGTRMSTASSRAKGVDPSRSPTAQGAGVFSLGGRKSIRRCGGGVGRKLPPLHRPVARRGLVPRSGSAPRSRPGTGVGWDRTAERAVYVADGRSSTG